LWSADWIIATIANLLFSGVFAFLAFEATFHGSRFFPSGTTQPALHCDPAANEVTADTG
jgi:hypothetical protein